jgi:hypothetical protein
MQFFCTYFDQNYLGRALVLHQSLVETGAAFTLWALCLDEESLRVINKLALPGLSAVAVADLEAADPEVAATKSTRSRIEYYFTLTPALPRYLLSLHPEIDVISYLDADLRFYGDPGAVLDLMRDGSVLIIPHGFSDGLAHLEVYGRYNVGMVSFRRDPNGMTVLDRWRKRCIEWCYDRIDEGRFADQAYLNDWPDVHPGVIVVDRAGIGLGPWNFSRFVLQVSPGGLTVDGAPLVFYHFHAFKQIGPHLFDDGLNAYGRMDREARSFLYGGYVRDLDRAGRSTSSLHVAQTARGAAPSVMTLLRLLRHRRLLFRFGRSPGTR